MNKLISVIIPIYNSEKYLIECVNSVMKQTYANLEIILVDDGSKDNSGVICDNLAINDKRIIVIHKKNGGASDARNRGLQMASGEYIHFVDSDDLLLNKNVYEKLFASIDTYAPEIIFSLIKVYDESLSSFNSAQPFYRIDGLYSGNIMNHILKSNYKFSLTCPVNKLFNREFLINNNLFFVKSLHHEEDEWLPKVIVNANSSYFYNEYIYKVRHRCNGSLSEIPNEINLFEKARDKITFSKAGIEYMINMNLDNETLSLIIEHYIGYFMDGIIDYGKIKENDLKRQLYIYIKNNRKILKYTKYATRKNLKILYISSLIFGMKLAVKMVLVRYN